MGKKLKEMVQNWENLDNKLGDPKKLSNNFTELENLEMRPTPIRSIMKRKLVNSKMIQKNASKCRLKR